MSKNVLLAAVGGQGLVLTTRILAEAALAAGFDVKTNDVVGLSQRGGKIWGSVKIAKKVHSPNILDGEADILIAFEALEAKRMAHLVKPGALIIMNAYEMAPSLVQQEKATYDEDVLDIVHSHGEVVHLDATTEAKKIGHPAVANILMLGIASTRLDIPREIWHEVIRTNVPPKSIELNLEAFDRGASGDYNTQE